MSLADVLDRNPDAETLALWLEKVPYAGFLGISAQVSGERILFVLPPSEKLIGNPSPPALHGGVVGAFMEQAGAFHLIAKMDKPVLPRIIDFSLDYLRPARLQETFAECTLIRQGRFIANVSICAWQDNSEKPIALARAHFLIPDHN